MYRHMCVYVCLSKNQKVELLFPQRCPHTAALCLCMYLKKVCRLNIAELAALGAEY